MSDIKAAPCDYQVAGSIAVCGMDIEHPANVLPAPLSVLQHQLTAFSCKSVMTYSTVDDEQEQCRIIPGCQDTALLRNLGLDYFSNNNMHPLKNIDPQVTTVDLCPSSPSHMMRSTSLNNIEARLYRSLENLHWSAVADSSLYAINTPYRSVDSEFIFHCKATSHWYEDSVEKPHVHNLVQAQGNSAFCPEQTPAQKDFPPFAKVPLCLLSPTDERSLNRDAKRELKEKLRLHSSKVVEPNKPIRPHVSLADLAAKHLTENSTCRRCKKSCTENCYGMLGKPITLCQCTPVIRQRLTSLHKLTSPDEIKQEAIRRLQLRRQNSSPNLNLHPEEVGKEVVKSKTAESLRDYEIKTEFTQLLELAPDNKRYSKGRLHIPTFEEFKKMRNRESTLTTCNGGTDQNLKEQCSSYGQVAERVNSKEKYQSLTKESLKNMYSEEVHLSVRDTRTMPRDNRSPFTPTHYHSSPDSHSSISFNTVHSVEQGTGFCQREDVSVPSSPICTSPVPRSPLQAVQVPCGRNEMLSKQHFATKKRYGRTFNFPEHSQTSDTPSSCCPSLLLDAADLSSYGVTLQKMKDGLIGSALDLIKKRCSAEVAGESPAVVSCDLENSDTTSQVDGNQSPAVSMEINSCSAHSNNELSTKAQPTECNSSLSCRRASLDAAYEAPDSVKTQRDCRLRPHFSDPMPADAVKRKQLEMKIAAAARLQAQRRRQEKDTGPVLAKSNTVHGCSSDLKPIESSCSSNYSQRTRQRWSNLSCLSTDSGIVGLHDDREEKDEEEEDGKRNLSSVEVERVDSGIGPALAKNWKNRATEASTSLQVWESHRPCTDCGERDFSSEMPGESRGKRRENLCEKCAKRRTERKEAILEFVNTEASYGEDLKIIKEEFYVPMQSAGLLTPEQLAGVFSNVQELIDLNEKFTECLQEAIDQAYDQDDEDLLTVCIGEIFLEFVNMLPAFQTYCLQQSASINMLNSLEKEKELLRIFLDVSQNDNTILRRMNLRSFLIAPLQRVTKYPLLLCRIIKATIEYHPDHSSLREAKSRVESHLEHINMKTKQESNSWSLRSFRRDSRRNREVINIEMREISIKTVGWSREDTRFVMEGSLQIAQPADGQWTKKGTKALKFQNVHVLLMVNMKRLSESCLDGMSAESSPQPEPVRDAVLALIRDKNNGKFALFREPLKLCNCVVSADPDCSDTFELLEIRREAFVFRDSDKARTHHWFRQIKRYSRELGSWKKRRNALPNIMISTNQNKS